MENELEVLRKNNLASYLKKLWNKNIIEKLL